MRRKHIWTRYAWILLAGALGIYLAVRIPQTLQEDADYQARCGFTSGPPLCTENVPIW